jgi:hypothetical protein
MNQEQVITYLQSLDINQLGDLLIEVGAFRNQEVCKSEVENHNGIELYYDEYRGVDYCDVFIFPRQNEFVMWGELEEDLAESNN